MSVLKPNDICEVVPVSDDREYQAFRARKPRGILLVPEVHKETGERVFRSDGGDFQKWLKHNASAVAVERQSREPLLHLRSGENWLPLVFLASDMTLGLYLNLVANYLYDKMRGALQGEKRRVHLSAVYEEPSSGMAKRFNFEGDVDALQKAIKKFDLNEFLDDKTPPK